MPDQSYLYKNWYYFAFVFDLLMHSGFLLPFLMTLIPVTAILCGFSIKAVFSVSLMYVPEIVCFCVLYFSVILLELNVAIVHYNVN